jgi:uncharacterized membrane-anchored protein
MVRSRPRSARPLRCASILALTIAAMATSTAMARERVTTERVPVIEELSRPTRQGYEELILEMAPLRRDGGGYAGETAGGDAGPSRTAPVAAGPEPKAPAPRHAKAAIPLAPPDAAPMAASPAPRKKASAPDSARVETAAPADAPSLPDLAGEGSASHPPAESQSKADAGFERTRDDESLKEAFKSPQEPEALKNFETPPSQKAGGEAIGAPLKPQDEAKPLELGSSSIPRIEPDWSNAPAPAPAPAPAAGSEESNQARLGEEPASADERSAKAKGAAAPTTNPGPIVGSEPAAPAQDEDAQKIYAAALARGVKGPAEVRLAGRATLWLPAGRVYVSGDAAKQLYSDVPGAWDDRKLGIVLPISRDAGWVAFVELVDDGYVQDQDGQGLEPEGVLAGLRRLAAQENGDRRRAGEAPLALTGWIDPPHYDAQHRLSSCLGVTAQGSTNPEDRLVDCTAFALGRDGAFKVQIVAGEEDLARFKNEASELAAAIIYEHGRAYGDIDAAADKAAPYDLSGLMTGGMSRLQAHPANAHNPQAKPGLFALIALKALKLWKILLIVAAGLVLTFRWLRGRRNAAVDLTARRPTAKRDDPAESFVARLLSVVRGRVASLRDGAALPTSAAMHTSGVGAAGSTTASRFAKATAFVKARLLRRDRDAAQAGKPEAQPQARFKPEAASSTLSRLASLMRKQEQGHGRAAAARSRLRDLDGADTDANASAERMRPLPGAAPVAGSAPMTGAGSFDLVEPGDQAAASAALSAQQALRGARAS